MVALKLLKVDAYQTDPATKMTTARTAATESFSLMFSAAGPLPRFTSIHNIKHGALGEFKLFLSRRDTNSQIFYEAVFNRVR